MDANEGARGGASDSHVNGGGRLNCCGHFEVHLISTESADGVVVPRHRPGDSMQDLSVTPSSEHTQNTLQFVLEVKRLFERGSIAWPCKKDQSSGTHTQSNDRFSFDEGIAHKLGSSLLPYFCSFIPLPLHSNHCFVVVLETDRRHHHAGGGERVQRGLEPGRCSHRGDVAWI